MNIKKIFFISLGCISLGLGSLGMILPILPTVPFLMLSAFAFARSSKRLHHWFTNTRIYKENLESYVKGRGMSRPAKLRIMFSVTLLMTFGAVMMLRKGLMFPCILLGTVWVIHIIYFTLGVKTLQECTE